ncbi:nucleotidyltransferase domain-containing protein [Bacillus suaedaesalsae]|uniref:DUF4111 domain-containing protein n=1 Tax=Bacillus suaedaesalsae TaxID=2810349 RepID=A0ABS2DDI1_9BACI|nr:nucleotidyltransferase domain-containing protein [Bacillus suaedaesalsae]MBM6616503.1 DUF4111 domain-containing protein [Bacillus suaedaesalsae]
MKNVIRRNGLNSLPTEVQPLLTEYIHHIKQIFGEKLIGVYLFGSIALDAFDSNSDIDFVTVISSPMTDIEETVINEIHRSLHKMYPSLTMDGGYVGTEELLRIGEVESIHPMINGIELLQGSILNPVTGWILQNHGIIVIGSDVLIGRINVTTDQLVHYVNVNMKNYWKPRFEYVKAIPLEQTNTREIDEEIEWFLLGISRQFYTLREGGIISKVASGYYMTQHFPKHATILNEAIRIRSKSEEKSYYESEQERFHAAIRFIEDVLTATCGNK